MVRAIYWAGATVPRFLVASTVLVAVLLGGMLVAEPGWPRESVKIVFWVAVPLWSTLLRARIHGDRGPSEQPPAAPPPSSRGCWWSTRCRG